MIVVGVKYIASVSFGKDSLAMLLKLMEDGQKIDKVLFYNTGMEFDSILRLRKNMRPVIERYGAEYIELKPDNPFLFSMLEKRVKSRNSSGYHLGYGWCGGICRWGTTEKIRAIEKYKKSLGEKCIDYVGIAFDEPLRFEKAKNEGKRLPLVEYKMTESDCLNYCRARGFTWQEQTSRGSVDLYDILDRVSCWCCANKNLKELRNIYTLLPEYWGKLRYLQSKIVSPMKGKGKSVFDLEHRFILEQEFLNSGKSVNTKEFYKELKKEGETN